MGQTTTLKSRETDEIGGLKLRLGVEAARDIN